MIRSNTAERHAPPIPKSTIEHVKQNATKANMGFLPNLDSMSE